MRFGFVHRVLTDALAVLGLLAVVSTAALSPWTNAALLVSLVVALAIPEAWQGKRLLRQFGAVAPLTLFVVEAVRLLMGRSPLDVAVEFAAILQIIRLATRRGAAHDQQILVLALLHFIAGTVLGGGLTYGLCFLGYLVVAPGALVLSHLRREVEGNYRQGARDRTGLPVDVPRILRSRRVVGRGFLGATCLLSLPIPLFTVAIFLMFPRIGLSLLLLSHPHTGRMVGFSGRVDLGDVGVLRDDPTIALRFELRDLPDPPPLRMTLRLRGTALDTYDGRAWSRSEHEPTRPQPVDGRTAFRIVRFPDPRDRTVFIDLEPIDPPVVFLPDQAVALRLRAPPPVLTAEPLTLQRASDDELRYAGPEGRGIRYDVYVAPSEENVSAPLPEPDRNRYLALPAEFSARIGDLARKWTAQLPTPAAKALEIERRLRGYTYDLHSPSAGTPEPVDHFLFVSHRGHCEFFSTAMALMLRTVGIPSRNVTGFVGGTWNRFGRYYAVREGDAHSWVEAYIDDPLSPGWRTFDPTPTGSLQPAQAGTGAYYYVRDFVDAMSQRWETYVVGYDLHKQIRLFDELARGVDRLRGDSGRRGAASRSPATRWTLAGVLFLGAAGYLAWRRRVRGATANQGKEARPHPRDAQAEAILSLYRALESAMLMRGVSRGVSVPPLRHAEELGRRGHPLAPEVLSLTHVYLATRFGGAPLSDELQRDFGRRVQELRESRAAAVSSAFAPRG
jgi:protein-glutamine gamma-glutamyltransferase